MCVDRFPDAVLEFPSMSELWEDCVSCVSAGSRSAPSSFVLILCSWGWRCGLAFTGAHLYLSSVCRSRARRLFIEEGCEGQLGAQCLAGQWTLEDAGSEGPRVSQGSVQDSHTASVEFTVRVWAEARCWH